MEIEISPEEVTKSLMKCINFAACKHETQRRKNAERSPYINHPISVAYILTNEASVFDLDVIQTALLHDTVEDTNTTLEEIEREFGKPVRDLVAEVTDDKSLPKNQRKQLQIEKATNTSYKAKLVKLADKLHNLRDLESVTPVDWSKERVIEYFKWSKKVVNALKGTNDIMENRLEEVFKRNNI